MNAKSHAANSQHLLEHSSILWTEPTSLYVPALIPPFKVTSLNTFPALHWPAIVGFTLSDCWPWAMRPLGVLAEDGPAWFGPKNPFGCGFTFEVKFGVMNASDVLSAKITNCKCFIISLIRDYQHLILNQIEEGSSQLLRKLKQLRKEILDFFSGFLFATA